MVLDGALRASSGAATSSRSRCWTMWADASALDRASRGDSRARPSATSAAGEAPGPPGVDLPPAAGWPGRGGRPRRRAGGRPAGPGRRFHALHRSWGAGGWPGWARIGVSTTAGPGRAGRRTGWSRPTAARAGSRRTPASPRGRGRWWPPARSRGLVGGRLVLARPPAPVPPLAQPGRQTAATAVAARVTTLGTGGSNSRSPGPSPVQPASATRYTSRKWVDQMTGPATNMTSAHRARRSRETSTANGVPSPAVRAPSRGEGSSGGTSRTLMSGAAPGRGCRTRPPR